MLTTLAWLILAGSFGAHSAPRLATLVSPPTLLLVDTGNTCFPILLRLWFLILRVITFGKSPVVNLLHRKPRAYYTHLFSFKQTFVVLTFILSSLALQFIVTTALDFNYGNGELTGLSGFYKIWNAGFQSISTRYAHSATQPLIQLEE